ncbi:MAG TPA: hypothetical protein VES02_17490, partial [Dermatophilaceae bacterium]|nr:hypothetical protein [Dermatophilaceae bacterium]
RMRFALADDLVADHKPDSQAPSVHSVGHRGAADASGMGPVYRRVPGGDIIVPTGRVLVRFGEHDRAENHRHELEGAGYLLDQVPSYAPHAAWLRAPNGSITDALRNLEQLSRLADVVSVEPQMIGERSNRA